MDKADLIQGPTLAELNANDESLLGDLNFDDFMMPSQLAMNGDRGARAHAGSTTGMPNVRRRVPFVSPRSPYANRVVCVTRAWAATDSACPT